MTAQAIATARPFATRALGAPRWALVAAHLVPLVALPSGIWRIFVAAGASLGTRDEGAPIDVHGWESVYIIALSLVTEAAALLTLGFVRPWGERLPGWIPLLGSRRVAPRAAVVAGALGALLIGSHLGLRVPRPDVPGPRVLQRRLEGADDRLVRTSAAVGAAARRGHLRLSPPASRESLLGLDALLDEVEGVVDERARIPLAAAREPHVARGLRRRTTPCSPTRGRRGRWPDPSSGLSRTPRRSGSRSRRRAAGCAHAQPAARRPGASA